MRVFFFSLLQKLFHFNINRLSNGVKTHISIYCTEYFFFCLSTHISMMKLNKNAVYFFLNFWNSESIANVIRFNTQFNRVDSIKNTNIIEHNRLLEQKMEVRSRAINTADEIFSLDKTKNNMKTNSWKNKISTQMNWSQWVYTL